MELSPTGKIEGWEQGKFMEGRREDARKDTGKDTRKNTEKIHGRMQKKIQGMVRRKIQGRIERKIVDEKIHTKEICTIVHGFKKSLNYM
jgi:hypothetical protein